MIYEACPHLPGMIHPDNLLHHLPPGQVRPRTQGGEGLAREETDSASADADDHKAEQTAAMLTLNLKWKKVLLSTLLSSSLSMFIA